MAATNAPLTSGMHHCRCRQGFSSFFQKRSDGLGRDLIDEAEFDRFAGQQAQRPMVVSVRDGAAGDGNEVGLLRTVEGLTIVSLALVCQDRIYSAFLKAGADTDDRVAADVECAAYLGETPTLSEFQQHLGARADASSSVARVDEGLQARAVGLG